MAVFVYGPETVENTRVFGFPNAAAGVAQPGISQRRVGGENGRKSGCRAAPFRKWTRVHNASAPWTFPKKSALREKVLLFRGGLFSFIEWSKRRGPAYLYNSEARAAWRSDRGAGISAVLRRIHRVPRPASVR